MMRYPHELSVICARIDHMQIVIFVQLSHCGLHVVLGQIVDHIQTSYSIFVCGDERSFAFAHRQRCLGHVAQLGRERFVFRFLQIAQLVAFLRTQCCVFCRFGVIVLKELEVVLVEHWFQVVDVEKANRCSGYLISSKLRRSWASISRWMINTNFFSYFGVLNTP